MLEKKRGQNIATTGLRLPFHDLFVQRAIRLVQKAKRLIERAKRLVQKAGGLMKGPFR